MKRQSINWEKIFAKHISEKRLVPHPIKKPYNSIRRQPNNNNKKGKRLEQTLHQRIYTGTSLVAQWLRIRLPMQGTQVPALVWEDPTCRGATKPVRHNYWTCALEPTSHNYWACVPQLLKPARLVPMLHNNRSHHNEKPAHRNKE